MIKIVLAFAAALGASSAAMAQTPAARPAKPPTAASIMADADANKDGAITWAEAEGAKWSRTEFANGDRNKDGKITLDELKAAMTAAGEKP